MGAVPKSKIGPRRKRLKRTHQKITPVALIRCETCGDYARPHHVCSSCGSFRGIQVIELDEE